MIRPVAAVVVLLAGAFALAQDPAKQKLRDSLKDHGVHASWIYDDLPAAYAAAKKDGRPVLAVFR